MISPPGTPPNKTNIATLISPKKKKKEKEKKIIKG